jgi:AAA15 family ATPase/GTPase
MVLGRIVVVDEVGSTLHPKLSVALIQMFKDPEINKLGAQLVFTSHDVPLLGSLIDDEISDRDEVWFTEKDRAGATTRFSVDGLPAAARREFRAGLPAGTVPSRAVRGH